METPKPVHKVVLHVVLLLAYNLDPPQKPKFLGGTLKLARLSSHNAG